MSKIVTKNDIESALQYAKTEGLINSKNIEDITKDTKNFIRQKENSALVYLINSINITDNKDWIKKLLDYLNEKYHEGEKD